MIFAEYWGSSPEVYALVAYTTFDAVMVPRGV